MEDFFVHKDAYAVLTVVAITIGVVIPFVAHYWYRLRRAEMELSLKQAMVERGMSAAEIWAVIEAGESGKPESDQERQAAMSHKVRA
jgi:hypothetical protein